MSMSSPCARVLADEAWQGIRIRWVTNMPKRVQDVDECLSSLTWARVISELVITQEEEREEPPDAWQRGK